MVQLRILPDIKLIIIKYSGEVAAPDINQILATIVEKQPERTGFKTLSINNEATFDLSSDEMVQIMDWLSAHRPEGSRTAMVVKDLHGFGLSRMWASHSEDRLPHDVQIFYSVEEACLWLEIDQAVVDEALREKS